MIDEFLGAGPRAERGIPARPGQTEILILVPEKMAEGLRKMAIAAKQKPAIFNANLLAAAYSARVMDTGDAALERAVRGDMNPDAAPAPEDVPAEIRALRMALAVSEKSAKGYKEALSEERQAVIKLRAELAAQQRGSGEIRAKIAEIGTKVADAFDQGELERARAALAEAQVRIADLEQQDRFRDDAFRLLSENANTYLGQRDSARRDLEAEKKNAEQSRGMLKAAKDKAEQEAALARNAFEEQKSRADRLQKDLNNALGAAALARVLPAPRTANAQAEVDALSKAEVSTIRGYFSAGLSPFEISRRVNVSTGAVNLILKIDARRAAK